MDQNRPQGRKKNVTGSAGNVHKRGEGLGTGPVGGGSAFQKEPAPSQQRPGQGQSQRSSGGKSPLLLLIVAAFILFGGGGGVLSGLLGGSPATTTAPQSQTVQQTQASQSALSGYSVPQNVLQTLSSGSTQSSWGVSSNEGKLDRTVAPGSREKRVRLLGNGRDTVTVMIYMCGTDLESKHSMGTRDIMEMAAAKYGSNVHILLYTGGCLKWNNQIISSRTNQIYEVVDGGIRCLVSDAGDPAMTRPETLTSFIQWCGKNYPANRNELIFWDHGGGSVSGYGYDEKNSRSGSMSLAGIDQALQNAGVTFDFIGFDACLMGTVEHALMLEQYADYMIASEETEPGIGWYYTDWLNALGKNTSIPTIELGQIMVDSFVETCARNCRGQSATLSVIDLAELAHTVPNELKDFSKSLSSMIANNEYQAVSTARNGAREFARSTKIDQIDLVDFARNLGSAEAKELTDALLGAVKYNRTSSDMTNAYGISIFFPYRRSSTVDKAVSTYDAIGMDESYSQCIREFASLEVGGQVSAGGTSSALPSLLGQLAGYSSSSSGGDSEMIGALLSSFLGGDLSSISGLTSGNTNFFSARAMSDEETAQYLSAHYFDPSRLVWQENGSGQPVILLPEDQWDLVVGLDLNMFVDDGEGFIDLGLDNVYAFDDDGCLTAPEKTWVALNGQAAAYYHEYTSADTTSGYIPVLLNGERAELLVRWDNETGEGSITGARSVYKNNETDTVAKSLTELADGDTIDLLCDYYTYEGQYQDSYKLGEQITVNGDLLVSDVTLEDNSVLVTYRFTDLYQQHYWTQKLEG